MSITIQLKQAIENQFAGNHTEDTVLHKAAFNGAVDVMELLCSRTSQEEIDQRNLLCCTPLRLAATRKLWWDVQKM
jgi:ankyrin repeat protein